ncbi:arsenite methyltransferase [Methanococcoides seepicolus]|uniref:Arsenite methyltransferase n=1 Tax=Methanococcoides seepicolus TaxID=2828780 RepID=A0A9E5DC68_9EURY|nr:arsenite methyltransferase [Methanococcoides seepicolus]MCM1987791.1 arsenite methyltransferase [Methanococcoides seepicolus]
MDPNEIKKMVKQGYSEVARTESSCCSTKSPCCSLSGVAEKISKNIGYSEKELDEIPEGANLGLGCGNPTALASLKLGETVLDLGSGAGFDCFLAASRVGKEGKVIGVDMTPEMIKKARENASNGGYTNVEFKLGDIEEIPIADASIDVVIPNCVINLVPSKDKVFREIFRILKNGGRFIISDMVLLENIPDKIKESAGAYIGCISGAILKKDYLDTIKDSGFEDIEIIEETNYPFELIIAMVSPDEVTAILKDLDISMEEAKEIAESVISIEVSGIKPF